MAAYPETHPQAHQPGRDLDNLKRKLDAGATRAITNFFFDTVGVPALPRPCLAAGITAPIVPGIMPVTNFAQAATDSAHVRRQRAGLARPACSRAPDDDPETRRMVAAVVAAEQVRLLQANGVDEFHFYTLNRPDLTYAIAHILGVRPVSAHQPDDLEPDHSAARMPA